MRERRTYWKQKLWYFSLFSQRRAGWGGFSKSAAWAGLSFALFEWAFLTTASWVFNILGQYNLLLVWDLKSGVGILSGSLHYTFCDLIKIDNIWFAIFHLSFRCDSRFIVKCGAWRSLSPSYLLLLFLLHMRSLGWIPGWKALLFES